jgi:hypothetical protein
MKACSYLPAGEPADTSGDTIGCRTNSAMMAATMPSQCWAAGPLGYGTCGEECEAFCNIVEGYCSAASGYTGPSVYMSMDACRSICPNFGRNIDFGKPGGYTASGDVPGDTLECRAYHLIVNALASTANQQMHCPHAASASDPCGPGPMIVAPPDGGTAEITDAAVPAFEAGAPVTAINSTNWNETIYPFSKRRMLLRDEGDPHLHLIDLSLPPAQQNVWSTPTDGPWARAMQLIGNGQVLGGRNDGYEVYDLKTGAIVKRVTGFGNTMSAYRLANGETMLTRSGTVLDFLGPDDKIKHSISYAGYGYVRLGRPTRNGTFLVPSDQTLFEGDANGKVLWTAHGTGWGHIWEPLLMGDGNTILCTAFGKSCDIIDKNTHMVTKRYGTATMPNAAMFLPNFFAEFEILPNGNIIVANWQGHGTGNGSRGIQVIEFDPAGNVVWFYKQDPAFFSSIQGVMVLDGKDPQYLHVQETSPDSTWQPVKP